MGELSPDLLDLDLDRKDSLYVKEDPKEAGKASPGRKRIWNICTKNKKNWTSGICESVRNIKEVETFL